MWNAWATMPCRYILVCHCMYDLPRGKNGAGGGGGVWMRMSRKASKAMVKLQWIGAAPMHDSLVPCSLKGVMHGGVMFSCLVS